MQNLFQEKTIFRLSLGFIILSLFFLLIFGFSLILNKVQAAEIGAPRVDSDKDGILDFYEVNVYGTDPNKADTDGDGYHDDMELMWGHDPLNPNPEAKYLLSTFSPFLRTSDAYVSRHLTVKGNLVADDIVKIAKDLKVYGPARFEQNVVIQGSANFQGSLFAKGKKPLAIKDNLKVSKNLIVKKTITTKNLVVTSRMTVEDLTLARGGKNRPAVGGAINKPLIISGKNEATGDWITTGSIFLRQVPDGGMIYFPSEVKLNSDAVINFTINAEGVKLRYNNQEFTWSEYTNLKIQEISNLPEGDRYPLHSFFSFIEEKILSSDNKIIGFKYKIYTSTSDGGLDLTNFAPISWIAYGVED
ncbi:MAG: hypothetical protein AB1465_00625 [Patescibacteria group bacterium]